MGRAAIGATPTLPLDGRDGSPTHPIPLAPKGSSTHPAVFPIAQQASWQPDRNRSVSTKVGKLPQGKVGRSVVAIPAPASVGWKEATHPSGQVKSPLQRRGFAMVRRGGRILPVASGRAKAQRLRQAMQGNFGESCFIHRPDFQQIVLSDAQLPCGVALVDCDFQ